MPSKLTILGDLIFFGCSNLKNLELPLAVETLKNQCLSATSLITLKFPPNLRTIEAGALNISKLEEIDTSENNYFEFKNGVLYSKDLKTLIVALSNITSINMEDSVETIQGSSFSTCSRLSNINITENVKKIGELAFSNSNLKGITVDIDNQDFMSDENNNLYNKDGTILYRLFDTGNVTIRDGVKNISNGALLNNGTITGITLPESFVGDTTSGWGIFPTIDYLCLPKNVKAIRKDLYFNIKNLEVSSENPYLQSINNEYILSKDGTELYWVKSDLKNVDIPESVEIIKAEAFMYLKAEEVKLPSNVIYIEGSILYYSNVKRIEIQSNIEVIYGSAFQGANNLTEVIIHKKNDGTLTGSPWGCVYGDRAIIWDE